MSRSTHRLQACMGGFCAKRDHCQNYHAADRSEPAERLCEPGYDGEGSGVQIVRGSPSQPLSAAADDAAEEPGRG